LSQSVRAWKSVKLEFLKLEIHKVGVLKIAPFELFTPHQEMAKQLWFI
jgi:hypothetical protein